MEPKIVEKEAFAVMGVSARGDPTTMDYEDIWGNRFMKHHDQVKALSTDGGYYGAYFDTGEENVAELVAGMAVGEVQNVPEGLVVRELPPATYAVFDCTVKTIGPTWQAIMGEWMPASGYEYDASKTSFEYYPPDTQDADAPVAIHVPVKRRPG